MAHVIWKNGKKGGVTGGKSLSFVDLTHLFAPTTKTLSSLLFFFRAHVRVSGEAARNEGDSRSSEENYQSLLLFTIKFAWFLNPFSLKERNSAPKFPKLAVYLHPHLCWLGENLGAANARGRVTEFFSNSHKLACLQTTPKGLLRNLGPESSNVPRPWEGPYMDETEIAVGKSNDSHRFVWEASKNNTFVTGRSYLMPCQIL